MKLGGEMFGLIKRCEVQGSQMQKGSNMQVGFGGFGSFSPWVYRALKYNVASGVLQGLV